MICDNVVKELPSYLQDLFPDKDMGTVHLVYLDKSNIQENISPKKTNFILDETENDITLDVTGNPLEVDLNGDETLVIEDRQIIQHWSENENKHFPVSVGEARNYLNSRPRNRTSDPVFVVCNGDNPLKTVIVGVQESRNKIFTCIVNILGCVCQNYEKVTLNSMEKSHLLLTGSKKCKIDYVCTFKYFIFGTFLQNILNIDKAEYCGSICVETTINKKCNLEKPCNIVDRMKIILQAIAGHRKSSLYFLWEDLLLIYNYLKILNSPNKRNPDIEICKNPSLIEDIYNHINEAVNTNLIKRELKVEFTLDNIRLPNIIDKLWSILKNCQDLGTLRDGFHYFFEELAESNSNVKLPEDTKKKLKGSWTKQPIIPFFKNRTSNMAKIINGILDGKVAVPTLDYSQALEFLMEIGAEKLKNDYQAIIKHFYVSSSKLISTKWNELESTLSVQETHRKTRITHFLKDDTANIKNCTSKLGYLAKLHVASEFIYLVKNGAFLPEPTFENACERICSFYMTEEYIINDFKDLLENPLCSFNFVINSTDNSIVKTNIPDFCSIRMLSVSDRLETRSVYVLSKYLIFPPNIYDDYDTVKENDETLYYTFKLESRTVTV